MTHLTFRVSLLEIYCLPLVSNHTSHLWIPCLQQKPCHSSATHCLHRPYPLPSTYLLVVCFAFVLRKCLMQPRLASDSTAHSTWEYLPLLIEQVLQFLPFNLSVTFNEFLRKKSISYVQLLMTLSSWSPSLPSVSDYSVLYLTSDPTGPPCFFIPSWMPAILSETLQSSLSRLNPFLSDFIIARWPT